MEHLDGKVAIITGAGGGTGRIVANTFAERGAKVVVADIDESTGKETVEQIKENYSDVDFVKVDTSKYEEVEKMVEFAIDRFGSIDVIYNNAGFGAEASILDLELEEYHNIIDVNQHGVFYGTKVAADKMKELGVKGTIINTASIWGELAYPNWLAYNVSKAAVTQITKSAAIDLAEEEIRVVGVAPGTVKGTDLAVEELLNKHMRQDGVEPERVADVVAFLASESADAINGSIIPVDDGYMSFKS